MADANGHKYEFKGQRHADKASLYVAIAEHLGVARLTHVARHGGDVLIPDDKGGWTKVATYDRRDGVDVITPV